MNIRYKQRFIIILIPLIILSCSKDEAPVVSPPKPVVETAAPPLLPAAPAAVSSITPVQQKKIASLAVLTKLKNRADMRAHDETVWQAAPAGTEFIKHDALQTHHAATANVRYESGSSLDLRENTLVIFDKDPGVTSRSPDRILLKNGRLVGKTRKELWVFTTAGLVQIKPVKKDQQAEATLGVDAAKKLNVKVVAGTAEVILKKNDKEFQKFNVAENSDFMFSAKADFNLNSDSPTVPAVKTLTQADLVIEAPEDNAISASSQLEVRGKLTEMGAKLLVNGQLAEIGEDLTFKKSIELTEGTNLVVFQLVRSDASVKFFRKNIRYDKSR